MEDPRLVLLRYGLYEKAIDMYYLYREQVVATTLERAWAFIRSPQNLEIMTPEDLSFEILTDLPKWMTNGLLIEYVISIPLLGKTHWVTEIKHIREKHSFVDEQRYGPYAFWYHYHEIAEVKDGVRFRDRVSYRLPLGPIGRLAHGLWVGKTLTRIFDFRAEALDRYFRRD